MRFPSIAHTQRGTVAKKRRLKNRKRKINYSA